MQDSNGRSVVVLMSIQGRQSILQLVNQRICLRPAQRADVEHRRAVPQERVTFRIAGD
jgi:hypothetical protein